MKRVKTGMKRYGEENEHFSRVVEKSEFGRTHTKGKPCTDSSGKIVCVTLTFMPLKALNGFLSLLRASPKQVHEWAPGYLSNLFPEFTYSTALLQITWSEHVTKINPFNPQEMSMRYTQVRLASAHQLVSGGASIQTQSVS